MHCGYIKCLTLATKDILHQTGAASDPAPVYSGLQLIFKYKFFLLYFNTSDHCHYVAQHYRQSEHKLSFMNQYVSNSGSVKCLILHLIYLLQVNQENIF
jgi:hypothetical protein